MPDFTCAQMAKMIDHSLLQPQLTDAELAQGCRLAREYDEALRALATSASVSRA